MTPTDGDPRQLETPERRFANAVSTLNQFQKGRLPESSFLPTAFSQLPKLLSDARDEKSANNPVYYETYGLVNDLQTAIVGIALKQKEGGADPKTPIITARRSNDSQRDHAVSLSITTRGGKFRYTTVVLNYLYKSDEVAHIEHTLGLDTSSTVGNPQTPARHPEHTDTQRPTRSMPPHQPGQRPAQPFHRAPQAESSTAPRPTDPTPSRRAQPNGRILTQAALPALPRQADQPPVEPVRELTTTEKLRLADPTEMQSANKDQIVSVLSDLQTEVAALDRLSGKHAEVAEKKRIMVELTIALLAKEGVKGTDVEWNRNTLSLDQHPDLLELPTWGIQIDVVGGCVINGKLNRGEFTKYRAKLVSAINQLSNPQSYRHNYLR